MQTITGFSTRQQTEPICFDVSAFTGGAWHLNLKGGILLSEFSTEIRRGEKVFVNHLLVFSPNRGKRQVHSSDSTSVVSEYLIEER